MKKEQTDKNTKTALKIIYIWAGSIILLSYAIYSFKININDIDLVIILTKLIPALNVIGDASFDKSVAVLTWAYMIITSPILLIILIIVIKKIEVNKPKLTLLIILPLLYFSVYVAIFGQIFNSKISIRSAEGAPSQGLFILNTVIGIGTFCALSGFVLVILSFIVIKIITKSTTRY